MNRHVMLNQLDSAPSKIWDLVVIGGGATGLGIALDAASRGFQTLLLEQNDFAKGTSGRSTKLVHGGVRYLAKGDIFLVTEALTERGRILKNAPHLSHNQEFLIPLYTIWDAILYTMGLTFYDWLAGRRSLGRSHFISRKRTISRLPLLNEKDLKGAVVYHDGQFDDARMAVCLAEKAVSFGALTINYLRLVSLNKNSEGRLNSLKALDVLSGKEYDIKFSCIINATGVFADSIMKMDNPQAPATIRPSQGIHLVLDKSFLESKSAIMIPKTSDGRVLFCIPWYDHVVVGTTDTPVDRIDIEPRAIDQEIEFILKTAGLYLKKVPLRKDILSVFTGLRPLAAKMGKGGSTKEISRRHKIYHSESGLISIVGGKWTTYRRMASETIDKAIKLGLLQDKACITKNLSLCSCESALDSSRLSIYGSHAAEIKAIIDTDPSLADPINPQLPYCRAEILWIIRNEVPCTVEDILSRRTRALILNAKASIEMAPVVASIMAEELGYDKSWEKNQIENYILTSASYLLEEKNLPNIA